MIQDLHNEVWMPVTGYHGIYEVSSMGRIKTLERWYSGGVVPVKITERLRKLQINHKGYNSLLLTKDKKSITAFVHRVVAKEFIPNPDNKPQVNHKNGDKLDNRVENLEWVTNQENSIHSFRELGRKGTSKKGAESPFCKKVHCDTLDIPFFSIREAGKQLNISEIRIIEVCRGDKSHVKGLSFRYM